MQEKFKKQINDSNKNYNNQIIKIKQYINKRKVGFLPDLEK